MNPTPSAGQTHLLHKLATIGVVKSFGPTNAREWFGYRRDMTPESLKFLVQDFLESLEKFQKEMVLLLPESIREGFKNYAEGQKKLDSLTFEAKSSMVQKIRLLKSMMTLPIYSWNGERYDLPVLLGPLIHAFSAQRKLFRDMTIIKRGTSFMEINFGFLAFRDFINFSQPMKLGKKSQI